MEDGFFYTCNRFKEQISDVPIKFKTGDILFLLDSTWEQHTKNAKNVKYLNDNGVCVISLVYDLIPITHRTYVVDAMFEMFSRWTNCLQDTVYGTLCISKYVMSTVKDILKWEKRIETLYLGCDLNTKVSPFELPLGKNILIVSTVEPRKGYITAVSAFNKFWLENKTSKINLIIVGKHGWKAESTVSLITNNSELGNRLFWHENLPDGELQYLYKNCDALVFASEVEGFGLATVEASFYGKPVILRDREIFREIGGEHATYFETSDDLCSIIQGISDDTISLPSSDGIKKITWKQCAQDCLKHLLDMRQDYIKDFLQKHQDKVPTQA